MPGSAASFPYPQNITEMVQKVLASHVGEQAVPLGGGRGFIGGQQSPPPPPPPQQQRAPGEAGEEEEEEEIVLPPNMSLKEARNCLCSGG